VKLVRATLCSRAQPPRNAQPQSDIPFSNISAARAMPDVRLRRCAARPGCCPLMFGHHPRRRLSYGKRALAGAGSIPVSAQSEHQHPAIATKKLNRQPRRVAFFGPATDLTEDIFRRTSLQASERYSSLARYRSQPTRLFPRSDAAADAGADRAVVSDGGSNSDARCFASLA
jgi:hypothetical protein